MISVHLPTQSSIMTVMTKAAVKASKGLLRDFSELENLQVSIKDNKGFVTNADVKADKIIKEELLYARPNFSVLSEESGEIVGSDPSYKWIIDPLDGTNNYMHGFPHWAISIALEKNDEIIAAVTFDPIRNEMFWAEKGRGSYINDKKIKVSGKRTMHDALISFVTLGEDIDAVCSSYAASIRRTGSTTLNMAYLAAGRFDLLLSSQNDTNQWDIAAGVLLIKEAGGVLATKDGSSTVNYKELAIMTNVDLLPIATKLKWQ